MSSSRRYDYEKNQQKAAGAVNTGAMAKVLNYDEQKGTMDVQPMTKKMINGQLQLPPPVLGVPVAGMCGGGLQISRTYKPGDAVVINYVGQDMDNAMAKGGDNDPNTPRGNSPTDAVCVGGVMAGGSTSNAPSGAEGISSSDGSLYVVFLDGKVQIKGDVVFEDNVEILGNLSVSGDVNVKGALAAETITVKESARIEGTLDISGPLIARGGIVEPWG